MESSYRCLVYLRPKDPLQTRVDLEQVFQDYFTSLGDEFIDADVIMTENGLTIEFVVQACDAVLAMAQGAIIANEAIQGVKRVVEIQFAPLSRDSVRAYAVTTKAAS